MIQRVRYALKQKVINTLHWLSIDEQEASRQSEIVPTALTCGTTGEVLWADLVHLAARGEQIERKGLTRTMREEVNRESVY